MKTKLREHFDTRLIGLQDQRRSWESLWEDCCRLCMPKYPSIIQDPKQNVLQSGTMNRETLINGIGIKCLNRLASGMQSSLTNPANRWFRFNIGIAEFDEDYYVRQWLHDVENVIYGVLTKSNFYNATRSMYKDLGCIGTAVTIILPDDVTGINAFSVPAGSYYIASNSRGIVDTLYRQFAMTANQVVDKFGYERCSKHIKKAFDDSNYETLFNITHAIEPNKFRDKSKMGKTNMPILSAYFETDADENFLSVGGYEEQMFFAPRWELDGDNIFGTSPTMDSYSDLNMLQDLEADVLEGLEKQIDPPMKGTPDIKRGGASVFPSGVTYQSSDKSVFAPAYMVNFDLNGVNNKAQEVELRIKEFFYNDLFNMIASTSKRMTAYEVSEKMGEKLQMLGNVADRLQYEYLDLVLDRIFAILDRKKMFPEPPEMIQGVKFNIEYIGLLTQARRTQDASNLMSFLGFVGNIAGVKPEVLDKVNFEYALTDTADKKGIHPKVIVPDDEVAEIRAQRQKVQDQANQTVQQGEQVKAAELMSKTPLDGNTALSNLLGGV